VSLSNTGAALKQRVRPPYYVAAEVGVVPPERDDTYYQADVAVSCTPTPATAQYLVDPVLIVEVLSPSTAAHDRTQKLPDYRRIASVQEIVLVSSQERRVEIWRRKGGNGRSRTRSAKWCCVDSIRVDLPVGAIYEDVDLMPEADAR
jgi:Uma2 family endonuclease